MTSGPPPAWYADPGGSGGLRYWDGTAWTDHLTAPPGSSLGAPLSTPTTTPPANSGGRKVWPLFAVIGVLFVVAVIAGIALALPKVVKAGGRFTDEAAQSTARVAIDAGGQVYALEGSYAGATPQRLKELESGLSFTYGPSTDFTTVSVLGGKERFVVAVASLSGRCYVAIIGDEVGAKATTGRLGDGLPCWASYAANQPLLPVENF